MTEKIATLIKENLPNFRGKVHLYRLYPPLIDEDWNGHKKYHEFVVVSGVNAFDTGEETYIFASDANGNVKNWSELDGSFKGSIDHIQALTNAGYIVR